MMETTMKNQCKTYLRVTADGQLEKICGQLSRIAPCKIEQGGIECGLNCEYDTDVNVMVRRTIKDLLGREQELKELQKTFSAQIWLVIAPQIVRDCEEPRQILSLEEDIIAFLYKSGVKPDLDYYVY
ncbi:MAG: hypothetical protein ACI4MH_05825 [Candidatus Coproplasma sp.]